MRNSPFAKIAGGAALAASVTAGTATATAAQQTGLLALYSASDEAQATIAAGLQSALRALGCRISLMGPVGDANGPLDIDDPDHFALIACNGPVLGNADKRDDLNTLLRDAKNLRLLEGNALYTEHNNQSTPGKRAYVIKISHYNNDDPSKRDADLAAIDERVLQSSGRYQNELFIDVARAQGMERPDEVVVLFYDTPQAGDAFRDSNGAILKMIGGFNQAHITRFTYVSGQSGL